MSLIILILSMFAACGNNHADTAAVKVNDTVPAEIREVKIEVDEDQQPMLVGKFTKEDLQKPPYAAWFQRGYESFEPSPEAMELIEKNISQYEIVVLMGTWCPDSRREVPHLLKILDKADYDMSKLTMIGVDRSKTTPENLEKQYDLNRVPTFIFLKDGKEVNRYVEYPRESIEVDIAKILTSQEYKHSYAQ